jgi:hypothetical protein
MLITTHPPKIKIKKKLIKNQENKTNKKKRNLFKEIIDFI